MHEPEFQSFHSSELLKSMVSCGVSVRTVIDHPKKAAVITLVNIHV